MCSSQEQWFYLLQAGVSVERDCGVKPLSVLEHVEGQSHFRRFAFFLDPKKRSFKVQPKADFLMIEG